MSGIQEEEEQSILPKEEPESMLPTYGTVNSCCDQSGNEELQNGKETNLASVVVSEVESQKATGKPRKPECSCTAQYGACQCGQKQMRLRFEPWSRRKTAILGTVMVLLIVWIIVVASMKSSELL